MTVDSDTAKLIKLAGFSRFFCLEFTAPIFWRHYFKPEKIPLLNKLFDKEEVNSYEFNFMTLLFSTPSLRQGRYLWHNAVGRKYLDSLFHHVLLKESLALCKPYIKRGETTVQKTLSIFSCGRSNLQEKKITALYEAKKINFDPMVELKYSQACRLKNEHVSKYIYANKLSVTEAMMLTDAELARLENPGIQEWIDSGEAELQEAIQPAGVIGMRL